MGLRTGWGMFQENSEELSSWSVFAGQIKTGAPCRSERLAKYNQHPAQLNSTMPAVQKQVSWLRLLRIEEELGPKVGPDHPSSLLAFVPTLHGARAAMPGSVRRREIPQPFCLSLRPQHAFPSLMQ